jgi:hypothetical protein
VLQRHSKLFASCMSFVPSGQLEWRKAQRPSVTQPAKRSRDAAVRCARTPSTLTTVNVGGEQSCLYRKDEFFALE